VASSKSGKFTFGRHNTLIRASLLCRQPFGT
jgi:hypothetical protein